MGIGAAALPAFALIDADDADEFGRGEGAGLREEGAEFGGRVAGPELTQGFGGVGGAWCLSVCGAGRLACRGGQTGGLPYGSRAGRAACHL